jgi:hypothetical protein
VVVIVVVEGEPGWATGRFLGNTTSPLMHPDLRRRMRMRRAAGTGVPDGDDLLGVYDGLAVRLDAPGLGGSNPRLEAIESLRYPVKTRYDMGCTDCLERRIGAEFRFPK